MHRFLSIAFQKFFLRFSGNHLSVHLLFYPINSYWFPLLFQTTFLLYHRFFILSSAFFNFFKIFFVIVISVRRLVYYIPDCHFLSICNISQSRGVKSVCFFADSNKKGGIHRLNHQIFLMEKQLYPYQSF